MQIWLAFTAFFALSSAALAEEKVLIIGIDYTTAEDERMLLSNPVRDAREISRAFSRAGVDDVILLLEPDQSHLRMALSQFSDNLSEEDVAIIYYAGHAVQYEGENYIVAGDGKTLINLINLIDTVNQRSKATVVILDACRNSPYGGIATGRSVTLENGNARRSVAEDAIATTGGLAQIGDLRGLSTVVFFSTEPGNVATDGEAGEGSPFAKVFAREVRRRQSLDDLLRRTAIRVNEETGGQQSPWRQGDIPFDVFVAGMKVMAIP